MRGGQVWRLTPAFAHGSAIGSARIRLIADVYADDACQHLAERAALAPATASQPVLAERVAAVRGLAGLGCIEAAERWLLRLFYAFALPEGTADDV